MISRVGDQLRFRQDSDRVLQTLVETADMTIDRDVFILSNKFQNLARRRWKLATNLGLTDWSSPTLNLILMLPLAKSSWSVLALTPQVSTGLVRAKFYLADIFSKTIRSADMWRWREAGRRVSVMVGCVIVRSLERLAKHKHQLSVRKIAVSVPQSQHSQLGTSQPGNKHSSTSFLHISRMSEGGRRFEEFSLIMTTSPLVLVYNDLLYLYRGVFFIHLLRWNRHDIFMKITSSSPRVITLIVNWPAFNSRSCVHLSPFSHSQDLWIKMETRRFPFSVLKPLRRTQITFKVWSGTLCLMVMVWRDQESGVKRDGRHYSPFRLRAWPSSSLSASHTWSEYIEINK